MPSTVTASILLVSTGAGIGGEESFTTGLAESLLARGWDVRVAAVGTRHVEELRRRGIPVVDLPVASRSPLGLLRGAKALARFASDNTIRLIHSQSVGPALMTLLAKGLGLFGKPRPRLLWHDHGIQPKSYWWVSRLFNRLDQSITCSDYERNLLISHGMRPEKIRRIHNGINLSAVDLPAEERQQRRKRIREERGWSDETPVVGYVGRLSPEKAPDVFVASFPFTQERVPDVRYVIVGDGPMRPEVEQMRHGLAAEDRIVMTGFRRDVPDLMCALDVLALTSHVDTFSLTTLEAMAMHLPCVVTHVCGCPEQVTDGENGYVVPDGRPDEVGRALADVLLDPAKRSAFGETGYQRVRDYLNSNRMVAEIEDAYRRTLDPSDAAT